MRDKQHGGTEIKEIYETISDRNALRISVLFDFFQLSVVIGTNPNISLSGRA
jgi:hypothetical protein